MRWLAQLLADRHAVGLLLESLKNIKFRNRGEMTEWEIKWQQRKDQEEKHQLGEE